MAHDVFTVHVDSNNNNKMSKWKEEQVQTKKKQKIEGRKVFYGPSSS